MPTTRSKPPRRGIGTKLLLVILPCLLVGGMAMFLAFEDFIRHERVSALKTRLDSFAVTQGASLVASLWSFDRDTIHRVFRAYADVPELLGAELYDAGNARIASATGAKPEGDAQSFRREVPLVQRTADGDYAVGHLVVTFHDGVIRREIGEQRQAGIFILSGVFLLLGAATLVAVRRMVSRPLGRLQQSLHRNTQTEDRQPLVWRSRDELGDVVDAYNRLLSEIDQRTRDIHHLAYHDPLTALPNRRLLEDRLGHAIDVAERQGRSIAVLFVDVDNFKVINDTLGHEIGDGLLRVVGSRVCQSVRTMDSVARWGGDEFVVVLENLVAAREASAVAEKIIVAVGQPVELEENLLRVGASVGISLFPQDGLDVGTLIKNADLAMFEAKAAGRNTHHFFDETMNIRALRRLDIEAALRHGIAHHELELHYQPKVSMADGRLVGLEALLRWRRVGEGLIAPDDFIPVAEESDLIIAIGEWVLAETCAQLHRWRAAGHDDVQVAVNLSPRHLRHEPNVDRIIGIVEAAGIPARLIDIEVTEATVMQDPERTIAHLCRLRDYGFSIAIDDFGTGYSNLSYLRKLPVRTLKIDRSFVKDIEQDKDAAEIVRTIIAMANVLGLDLVAEGVETEGQRAFLDACGCTVAQGFHFARPMPVAELDAWRQRGDGDGRDRAPAPLAVPVLMPV